MSATDDRIGTTDDGIGTSAPGETGALPVSRETAGNGARARTGAPPVPGDRRVRPLGVLAACIRRDAADAWSYRLPFAWRFVEMFMALFMLFFLSRLVGNRIQVLAGTTLTGGYFAFAVLGTALVAIVHGAMTSFASRLRADQTTGTLEAMLSTPSPPWLTIVGGSSYGIIQLLVTELITLGVAVGVFRMRLDARPLGIVVLVAGLVVILALFVAVGLLVTAFIVIFKRGQGVATLVVSVFSLLGGVYYPLSVLPPVLRTIGEAIPFTWAVDLVRGSLAYGQVPVARLGELAAIDVVVIPVAIWVLGKSIDRARRTGTLGQY